MCGPTPEELLLGSLGACTTVYVARNAALLEIPVESVRVNVSAHYAKDGNLNLQTVEKVTVVAGDLSQREIADLDHVASHCALGESLKRGILISDKVRVVPSAGAGPVKSSVSILKTDAPKPDDIEFCNDGSCCIPEPARS